MSQIELAFHIKAASAIPADHGYILYSALSRLCPSIHGNNRVAIHPLRGRQIGNRQLALQDWSRLTLRAHSERIPDLIQIAGKQIVLAGAPLRIGVPEVRALNPAPHLRSRLVTIKGFFELQEFERAVRRQLDALDVCHEVAVSTPRKRTLGIKQKEVVGFEVWLKGLTADESLKVQETGIGGRRHMGCGVFTPMNREGETS